MSSANPTKRSRTRAPLRAPDDVLEIDRKGDLVIRAGITPTVLMRVSSKHLTMASDVFEALLGPHFAEGQEQHNEQNPLSFADDSATSLEILLRIIHHKMETGVRPKDLPGLVIVSDKYGCISASRSYIHAALRGWFTGDKKDLPAPSTAYYQLSIADALSVAYITQDIASFETASNLALKTLSKPQILKVTRGLAPLLPNDYTGTVLLTSFERY
jgi:hypothetical protein